jgi:hypothetical protein
MRKTVWAAGWAVVVLAGGAARADEADAKAIVEKAIKAHGGAGVLNKLPAISTKAKGKFYGMGDGIDYTSDTQFQPTDKYRAEVLAGDFKFLQVVKGDKGWVSFGGMDKEMDKDELAEAKEGLYAANVGRLVPLTEEGYKLSALGAIKVGDRDAVGVRVEHKGHRDISLFFDKENGLLLRVERRAKDVMGSGEEYTAEATYGDYKKVDGIQVPHKLLLKRDGKRFIEQETTEAKVAEKLDDSVFAKP